MPAEAHQGLETNRGEHRVASDSPAEGGGGGRGVGEGENKFFTINNNMVKESNSKQITMIQKVLSG